jgi:RNA polymerase sigma factor (sigma-70 family)
MTISTNASFAEFYEATYHDAVRLATLLVRDVGHAAEICQETFAVAFTRWDRLATYDRPDLWLRRAVINRSISRRRRERSESKAMTQLGQRGPDWAMAEDLEGGPGVWVFVARLPTRQAQAMALVYGCDLSLDDAASVMRCSTGSVKTHLSRGRQTLASILKERP